MVIPQEKRNRLGEPHNYPSLFFGDKAAMKSRESKKKKKSMIFVNRGDEGQRSGILPSEVETPDSYRGVSSSIGLSLFR